jgi:GMP synthase (glutamine-hydrolysing)
MMEPQVRPGEKGASETVVVLDFGSQYAQLIVRRVREQHVYSVLLPHDAPEEEVMALSPVGIILSGGPASVYDPGAPQLPDYVLRGGLPVLGICYGMQLLARALGGEVLPSERREYGPAELYINDLESPLWEGMPFSLPVWMSHGDAIAGLPPGFQALASTDNSPVAAMGDPARRIYGVQFHPEVVHTPLGKDIIRNFLYSVCGCIGAWTPESFIASTVRAIRERVGDGRVMGALSGGVDSTVAATLVRQAVGDRLTCVFVDHGMLREGEAETNVRQFREHLRLNVIAVDASERFMSALKGVTDPEEKRRIIGAMFIRVFEDCRGEVFGPQDTAEPGEHRPKASPAFLLQGTLYPDVIESTTKDTKSAARIKTHHNVGGLPSDIQFRLVEPLKFLFKDEVREVGLALGLPPELVYKQPFPGPGLAVRIIGEVTPERVQMVARADAIVREEIAAAGLDREVWQYFAVLTPVRSVGVMGDGRTYLNTVAVRAVTSQDGMTADWARLPYPVLARISNRIVNEVPGVNRVVYDISSKPPATIEWE